jgi:hypothetical protein
VTKIFCTHPTCNTSIEWSWQLNGWKHTVNDFYSEGHKATPPEGTERPLNLIEELMQDSVGQLLKATAKYGPLVEKLTDMEFAGLFQVIQEERSRRITRLMIENPFLRRAALEQIAREEAAERN